MIMTANAAPENHPPSMPPPIPTEWRVAQVDPEKAAALAREVRVPSAVAAVYVARGLETGAQIREFLDLGLHRLHDPMLLPDVEPALDRLCHALDDHELIHVHGDYDVDGVTATAVVVTALRRLGANFTYQVPHRTEDGYDLKTQTVERAAGIGAGLVMTVDCGILAFDAADRARELGLDLIVTDHHHPAADGRLPDCVAVVNPNRADSLYPFPGLAGVGVAFKLMMALWERRGHAPAEILDDLVDYVALGTVADVAPMRDENRVLVSLGCKQLTARQKVGVNELLRVAGVQRVSPTNIGFSLGPRINAVGRLADSATALALMLETDPGRAAALAGEMDLLNKRRQALQEQALGEAREQLPSNLVDQHVVVLDHPAWHPGVVGLVAGNLAESLGRPVVVCSTMPDGQVRGSCRSTRSFNIIQALQAPGCAELFTRCGGHAFAAGFELPAENLPALRARLNEYALRVMGPEPPKRVLEIDAEIPAADIAPRACQALTSLAPFGQGNADPLLLARTMTVASCRTIGVDGRHLKLALRGSPPRGPAIQGVYWKHGADCSLYPPGASVDAVFSLDFNEYQGRRELQMTIRDMKRCP